MNHRNVRMFLYKYIFCQLVIITLFTGRLFAQYPASTIPDSLKTNAHLVVREYYNTYELLSVNKGKITVKKIITILDKNGENQAILAIPYDKNSSVNINKIVLYDKTGKKIKTAKQSDIHDSPAFSSYELYSENRVKYYIPDQAEYPYTVEYVWNQNMDNIISFGTWQPVSDYNMSLEHAKLTFIHQADIKVNKKELMIKGTHSVIKGENVTELWELNNIAAIEDEPYSVSLKNLVPCVYLMPEKLLYDKYEGNAGNWEQYGKWVYNLYTDRDKISDAEKIKIISMLENVPDTLERIKTLYKYMQDNSRYVAITMGIGGFQPFDAETVHETGYGDCKALSNYMHSLLKIIGVRSYPALVAAGTTKVNIFHDYPNFQQFNHVILSVIYNKDTIWLECTNQQIPFGFLGDFTDDRDVLLLTEKGGRFAHTRRYSAQDNLRTCYSEFNIYPTGAADGSSRTIYRGLQFGEMESFLSKSYDEQKKWLYSNSMIPSLQILDFSVESDRNSLPSAELKDTFKSKNYCSFSGKYMLLPLNNINVQKSLQKMLKTRLSDVLINKSFIDYDTITYYLPDNYRIESIPGNISINSEFGNYSYSVSSDKNKIIYTRQFLINEGRYDSDDYKKLYDFISSVAKADNAKVILTQ